MKPPRTASRARSSDLRKYQPKTDRLREECPLRAAVDVVRGRWKPSILFYLAHGTERFSGLAEKLRGITSQTLTLQLRQLEADGIVRRTVHAGVRVRAEYSLTDSGWRLFQITKQLEEWSSEHMRGAEIPAQPSVNA